MNQNAQDIHDTLVRFSEYGRASLLFRTIVSGDDKKSVWYSDQHRIEQVEKECDFQFSDSVKAFVMDQLKENRPDRLRCVYFNRDRQPILEKVTRQISLNCARAHNAGNMLDTASD